MSAPDTCPRCGLPAEMEDDGKHCEMFGGQLYQCGTVVNQTSGNVDEDWPCLARQRDALAARVKELEAFKQVCENPAALWANWLRGTVALPAGIGDVRQEQARVKELEAKLDKERFYSQELEQGCNLLTEHVKELEAYAERLEDAGDFLAETSTTPAIERWTAAKETKP